MPSLILHFCQCWTAASSLWYMIFVDKQEGPRLLPGVGWLVWDKLFVRVKISLIFMKTVPAFQISPYPSSLQNLTVLYFLLPWKSHEGISDNSSWTETQSSPWGDRKQNLSLHSSSTLELQPKFNLCWGIALVYVKIGYSPLSFAWQDCKDLSAAALETKGRSQGY